MAGRPFLKVPLLGAQRAVRRSHQSVYYVFRNGVFTRLSACREESFKGISQTRAQNKAGALGGFSEGCRTAGHREAEKRSSFLEPVRVTVFGGETQ